MKKKPKFTIYSGLEIELEYNKKKFLDGIGKINRYHTRGEFKSFSPKFKIETDGSLNVREFEEGETIEVISKKFKVQNYKEYLKDFENTIKTKSQTNELKEAICFNDTTGAHIHFGFYSTGRVKIPIKILKPDYLTSLNTKILLKLVNYGNKFQKIIDNWYRKEYARDFRTMHVSEMKTNKYNTWNYSLRNRYGLGKCLERLELRSFNLRGVTNWEDFHLAYEIVFETLIEEFTKLLKDNLRFEQKIDVKKDDILRYFKAKFEKEQYEICLKSVLEQSEFSKDKQIILEIRL